MFYNLQTEYIQSWCHIGRQSHLYYRWGFFISPQGVVEMHALFQPIPALTLVGGEWYHIDDQAAEF